MDVPSAPQIMVDPACVLEEAECGEDMDLPTDDHLMNLKALTEKLRLETRRPSYLEWKAQLETESFRETGSGKGPIDIEPEGKAVTPKGTVVNSERIQCKLPSGVLKGFGNIDEALSWLRRELVRHCLNSKTNVSFVSSIFGKWRFYYKSGISDIVCFVLYMQPLAGPISVRYLRFKDTL